MMVLYSNLDLVKRCDKFPYAQTEPDRYNALVSSLFKLHVEGSPSVHGYMPPTIVEHFQFPSCWTVDHDKRTVTLHGKNLPDRDANVAKTLAAERERAHFRVLRGWRNELFPVYSADGSILVNIERAAAGLFGIIAYSVIMTGYVRTSAGLKIWIPRRSSKKSTYPGMLDNTAGGGIPSGKTPLEAVMSEAEEEASFPRELLAQNLRSCGTVSYFDIRDEMVTPGTETGMLQPECIYVYDLEVPESFTPQPGDKESEDFRLRSVPDVQAALARGEFKTNCALVLLSFFVRNFVLTPENENDYDEIVARLHRKLKFESE